MGFVHRNTPRAIDLDGLLRRPHRLKTTPLPGAGRTGGSGGDGLLRVPNPPDAARGFPVPQDDTIDEYDVVVQRGVRSVAARLRAESQTGNAGIRGHLRRVPGTGTTHLAVAIAYAIRKGSNTLFTTAVQLIDWPSGSAWGRKVRRRCRPGPTRVPWRCQFFQSFLPPP